jgi:hypothetical protein
MLKLQVHIAWIKRAFERACFASIRLCTSVGLGLVLTACGDGALLTSDVNAPRAQPTEQPLAGAGSVFNGNGWYWDSTAAGTGLMIEAQDATAFVSMFVYDDAGEPVWYASSGAFTVEGSLFRFSGSLLEYTGGQSAFSSAWRAPTSRAVGNLDIIFTGTGTDTRAIVNLPGGRVWVTSRFNFMGWA